MMVDAAVRGDRARGGHFDGVGGLGGEGRGEGGERTEGVREQGGEGRGWER